MTGVYSGGLVYEYSEEGNDYGLVTISGTSVATNSDFAALKTQYAAYPAPTGDGGYKTDDTAATCPASSDTFDLTSFTGEELPAIPSGASKYMKSGAGTGPGLTGDGSQNAGGGSSSTATPGSGSATVATSGSSSTSTSTSTASKGAASSLKPMGDMGVTPFVLTGVVMLSGLLGMGAVLL